MPDGGLVTTLMSASPPHWRMAIMNTSIARSVAIGASIAAALMYLGIAFGVLDIGESADGGDAGLFEFGVMMGAVFGATALLLWLVRSRILWAAVAVVQVIVLVGYVAFSSYREPPVELWGTLIKVTQAVILVAVIYLIARARQAAATSVPSPTVPKGHAA
jgi:hypothetical protein